MVSDGERTGEDGGGFTVHTLAVREEERFACGIMFVEDTALSYKTLVHDG